MTSALGASTYSTIDLLLSSNSSLQNRISTLEQQTSTGLISQSYSGIAASSAQALNLQAASARVDAYTASINSAQGKASTMQTALSQVSSLISSMSASALTITSSSSASSVNSIAAQAKLALQQLASLMNTQYGGQYVFSGADSSNAPIPDAANITSSGMYTQIGAQVAALATTPSATAVSTVIANTVAIASSTAAGTTVYSSYLTGAGANESANPQTVKIGDSQSVTLDLPANQNVGATSDPNGTGSAISDAMRALSVLANSNSDMASNPDFTTLMQNVVSTLNSAGTAVAQEEGQIGLSQKTMTTAANTQASMKILMQTQLTNLTQVDMATAITQLQNANSQLEASYKILSLTNSMNLASFMQ